jgi:hypothetical protein
VIAHDSDVRHFAGAWVLGCPACEAGYRDEVERMRRAADPLEVTTKAGYDSPPRPVVLDERPVVDEPEMVLFWIGAAVLFVAILAIGLILVAQRPPHG